MNEPRPLGLYLHIPFCKQKCAYCDFYSICDLSVIESYLAALCTEIRLSGALYHDRMVDTVYVGGGTPSLLSADQLARLFSALRASFVLAPDAEITLEANPATLDEDKCRALFRAGVNRLSLGMQSADDRELQTLSRLHTFAAFLESYRLASSFFSNISLDLIYGLPDSDEEKFLHSLDRALSLAPQHISLYALKIEEGTPFAARRAQLALPSDDTVADMYLAAVRRLSEAGYEQYEISNFARPGFASRHNSRYWKREDYLGLGPAAHSFVDGLRYAHAKDLAGYLASLQKGNLPPHVEEYRPDEKEGINEEIMLSLRLVEGLSLAYLKEKMGYDILKAKGDKIALFCRGGFMKQENGRLFFTPKGFLVSNTILSELML